MLLIELENPFKNSMKEQTYLRFAGFYQIQQALLAHFLLTNS